MNEQQQPEEIQFSRRYNIKMYVNLLIMTLILGTITSTGFYWIGQSMLLQLCGNRTNAEFTSVSYQRKKNANTITKFAVFRYRTARDETFTHQIHERYVDIGMPRGTTIPILYRYTNNGIEASTDGFIELYLGGLLAGIIPLLILIWVWHLHLKDFKERGLIKDPLKENVLDLK